MNVEKLLSILKYSIICFFIIVIFILLKAFNYKELGIENVSCGEGVFSLYEYRKGNPNFVIYFGDFIVILSAVLGCILNIIIRSIRVISKSRF